MYNLSDYPPALLSFLCYASLHIIKFSVTMAMTHFTVPSYNTTFNLPYC